MAARNLYPAPECPRCGKSINRVKNTYYTDDGPWFEETKDCDYADVWNKSYEEWNKTKISR